MTKAKAKRSKGLGPKWRSRIVGRADVDPRSLKNHPLNWRIHPETQQAAIRDGLEQIGVIDDIIVNKRTGHILDGHGRKDLAIQNEEPTVGVLYVDLNEEEERLALAMYNPLAELAATDPDKLSELLGLVDRSGGPLDDLLAELEEKANVAVVREAASGTAGSRTSLTKKNHVMRMMLENPDVMAVERALAMTGKANRGEALLEICRTYMGAVNNAAADRQHDVSPESELENQLAQALGDDGAGGDGDARGNGESVPTRVSDGTRGRRVRKRSSEGGDTGTAAPDVERVPGQV